MKKKEEELRLTGERVHEAVNQQLAQARQASLQADAELEGAGAKFVDERASLFCLPPPEFLTTLLSLLLPPLQQPIR